MRRGSNRDRVVDVPIKHEHTDLHPIGYVQMSFILGSPRVESEKS
jgi:hypothetical protein